MNETWKKLINDSHQLKQPAHARHLICEADILKFQQLIMEVIQRFLLQEDHHVGFKAYINKELRNDLVDRLVANPPAKGELPAQWLPRIFEDEKFGIVLNNLEQYSNVFAEKATALIRPLLQAEGLPLGGTAFLSFMGNYGFTPFGVHKEVNGEEGFLFHLGPGKKQFYTWNDKKHNTIEHNTKVFHEFDDMLQDAQCYELEPGDVIFIPHAVYHIANTDEFSVSIVMDYINPPTDRFENELLKATGAEELSLNPSYQTPIPMEATASDRSLAIDLDSIRKKTDLAMRRKILELKSNNGLVQKSNLQQASSIPTEPFAVRSKTVFQLCVDEPVGDKTIIFARGHRIIKPCHPQLGALISRLNEGDLLTMDDLRQMMEPDWDMVEIFGFISDLLRIEAIMVERRT